ncbi:hypothetical protein PSCLAVI8L_130539 [Pseudoclavibacter sp. 8L]|nr:hypothetical protein PSCLAVI8L_130539 [Pseudoclavibacter sp. 8L]
MSLTVALVLIALVFVVLPLLLAPSGLLPFVVVLALCGALVVSIGGTREVARWVRSCRLAEASLNRIPTTTPRGYAEWLQSTSGQAKGSSE